MKFGLYAINYGTCGDPESLVRVAQYAESAGVESLWAGEHIVVPSPQPPDYGVAPEIPFLDAIVALALAAARHDDDHGRNRRHRAATPPARSARQATGKRRPDLAWPADRRHRRGLPRARVRRPRRVARRAGESHRGVPPSAARAVDDGCSRVPRPARRLRGRRRQSASCAIGRPADPDRRQQRDRASTARSRAPTVGSRTTSISMPHARRVGRSTATSRTTRGRSGWGRSTSRSSRPTTGSIRSTSRSIASSASTG